MSKVSIIIPTYNCTRYLLEAIGSVLEQAYKDLEILIVDSSTDNTKEILRPYIENEIVRYIYQEPGGVAAARNKGIAHVKGEYIAFLDADDIWLPEKIEYQMRAFQQCDGAGLAFTDYLRFDESGIIRQSGLFGELRVWFNKNRSSTSELAYGQIYYELLTGNLMHTSSVIVKKDILQEVGLFDETFNISEDYDLWLRIARKYPVLYVNRVLCKYRYHADGLSGSADVRGLRWRYNNIRVLEKHLSNNGVPFEYRGLAKNLLSQHCWDAGWNYFNQNLFKESRSLFFRGMRYGPFNWKNWLYWCASFLPSPLIESLRRLKRSAE